METISAASNSRLWTAARLAALAAYLLFACILGFRSPGMYYDEAIFLNGAVHMSQLPDKEPSFAHDPWSWFTFAGRRWPLMVMPYVGPMRAYLAVIPFSIFGPGYYTARILAAILGVFSIWGFSILVRDQFSARVAAAASWIIAIHPAYLALTIYQGAVAEWMVPFALLSIALARYLRKQTPAAAFWLGVAIGFGIWTRANVVWLVGSALLAATAVLGKRILIPLRHFAFLACGAAIGGAPLLWYEIRSHGATFDFLRSASASGSILPPAGRRLQQLSEVLLSDTELRRMWNGPTLPGWQPLLMSAIVLLALGICLVDRDRPARRIGALTFLFLLACMLLSRLVIADHHLIALVPIAAALAAAAAQIAWRRWRVARYAVPLAAIVYIGSAVYWNLATARGIAATGGVGMWSSAIDDVAAHLEKNSAGKKIKLLDWGFNNNLFVLSNARIVSAELFWGATRERSGMGNLWKDEIAPGDIYVLHARNMEAFPAAGAGFRHTLAASDLQFRRTQFAQKNGAPYAEVVEILPARQDR